jgi:hypothetical protein
MKSMKTLLAAVLMVCASVAQAQVANPAVTQDNLQDTICNTQYSAKGSFSQTVRPAVSYTNRIKTQLFLSRTAATIKAHTKILGRAPTMSDYELDHWVPIGAGGDPKDPKNLKLQLWAGPSGAKAKDVIETKVHTRLCNGTLKLSDSMACWKNNGWKTCLN